MSCDYKKSQNKEQNLIKTKLSNCINEKINDNISREDKIDFYGIFSSLEEELIEKDFLDNKKKKSYLKLFDKIKIDNKSYLKNFVVKSKDLTEKNGFKIDLYLHRNPVLSSCPYTVLTSIENYENLKFYKFSKSLNDIYTNGFKNKKSIELLMEMPDRVEFDKIHYRAPILLAFILYADEIVNPSTKVEKFEVNGKTYLRKKDSIE